MVCVRWDGVCVRAASVQGQKRLTTHTLSFRERLTTHTRWASAHGQDLADVLQHLSVVERVLTANTCRLRETHSKSSTVTEQDHVNVNRELYISTNTHTEG